MPARTAPCPLVPLRRVCSLRYGDALASSERREGAIPVYGSNGPVGAHDRANTLGPVIVVGRKGSHGKLHYVDRPVFAIDTTFTIDSRDSRCDLRWLFYVLTTLRLDRLSSDVGVPGLARERAYEQVIPFPDWARQRAVADYLDAETARIDALISAKRCLIELLRERSLTARSAMVLGGRHEVVPHPILGFVRRGWNVRRLRFVVPRVGVGVVVNPSSYFADDGLPFIHGANVREGWIDTAECKRISEAHSKLLWRSRLEPGDVVVVRAGYPGRAAVVSAHVAGANCASVLLLKRGSIMEPEFLAAFLNSLAAARQVETAQYGAAQEQINVSHIVDFHVPVPTREEQQAIVADLQAMEMDTKSAIDLTHRQASLLREHRQALITAAVTGELDIPGAA